MDSQIKIYKNVLDKQTYENIYEHNCYVDNCHGDNCIEHLLLSCRYVTILTQNGQLKELA